MRRASTFASVSIRSTSWPRDAPVIRVILKGSVWARAAMAMGTALASPARVNPLMPMIIPSLIRAAASSAETILSRRAGRRIRSAIIFSSFDFIRPFIEGRAAVSKAGDDRLSRRRNLVPGDPLALTSIKDLQLILGSHRGRRQSAAYRGPGRSGHPGNNSHGRIRTGTAFDAGVWDSLSWSERGMSGLSSG